MSIYLLDIKGWVTHVNIIGDEYFHSIVFKMIEQQENETIVENQVKIMVKRVPYRLSKRLIVHKHGKRCKVSMFKYQAVIEDLMEDGDELDIVLFGRGAEFAKYSQSDVQSNDIDAKAHIEESCAETWWKHAWMMIRSPMK